MGDVAAVAMDMSVDDLDAMVVNVPPLSCLHFIDDCLHPAPVNQVPLECCSPSLGDEMQLDMCCASSPATYPTYSEEFPSHDGFVHACVDADCGHGDLRGTAADARVLTKLAFGPMPLQPVQ